MISIPLHSSNESVFVSGSDDSLVKVWDVRALGIANKPVGIFYGHFSGVT